MKLKFTKFKFYLMIFLLFQGISLNAQTVMTIPPHASNYTGSPRGYWFTAPTNFTITGLKISPESGTGGQYIQVMKCNDPFPVAFTAQSTNFVTLAYISNAPNNVMQTVNIQVNAGDVIGIMGTTSGNANSYTASSLHTSTIGGFPVALTRFGFQSSIETGPATGYWGEAITTAGQLSRIEMQYTIGGSGFNNAGIPNYTSPVNFCTGSREVKVNVKNYGSNVLNTLQVQWTMNGVAQTPINITTPIDTINSIQGNEMEVTLGNYNFTNNPVTLKAWTTLPNGGVDTVNTNDTLLTTLTPSIFTVNANPDTVCANDISTITLSPSSGYNTSNVISWESSTNGTTWNTIAGANTPTHVASGLASLTYFRAKITTGTLVCTSSIDTINVISVSTPTVVGGQRCGEGTVNLSASTSAGNLKWYETPTGGVSVGTGNSFVTPHLTTSTTYYVASASGGSSGGGSSFAKLTHTPSPTGGVGTTNFGLVFDVLNPCTLDSVTLYPVSATNATGTVTIDVINASGTILHTAIVNVTGSPISNPVPQRVHLGFNLLPGTNLKMRPRSFTGITSLVFDPAANAPGGNYGYPYVLPGFISINHSTLTAAPTNTVRLDLYYYFYNWSLKGTGCESPRIPVTATINPLPILDLGSDLDTCIFQSTPMVLNPGSQPAGSSFVWDNNSSGNTRTINSSGTYHVTVTNQYGCVASDTINVNIKLRPLIDLEANGTSFCNGATKILDAGPGGQNGGEYFWNNGQQTQTIEVSTGGTYIVFVTSSDGCANSDTITIVEDGFAPTTLGIHSSAINSNTFLFSAINPQHVASYEWDFGDGSPISTGATPSHQYNSAGYYLVKLKTSSTCADKYDSAYVNIIGVGVNDIDDQTKAISIYPNPNTTGVLIIENSNNISIQKVSIYNILGQLVSSNTFTNNLSTQSIQLPSTMANGIYNITIETNQGKTVRKLEILK